MHRVFLADIIDPYTDQTEAMLRMQELENLVTTFGGFVIVRKIQKRMYPDYETYIGSGKLEEIIYEMYETNADLLILGNILKPRQLYAINDFFWKTQQKRKSQYSDLMISKEKRERLETKIEARDRIDLILKIFDKHAKTAEAKLQIELAAIKHMGPRIYKMGLELTRQGGGSRLARGQGETNIEIMRRHLKERHREIEKKIEEYKKMRTIQRVQRKKGNMVSVGIVGYTNVGKSSLLNAMTKREVLAENKLFATLETTAAKCFLGYDEQGKPQEIILHDTIGFIRDLPPDLIHAFHATLEDSIHSDILLHVVDATDKEIEKKIYIVDGILEYINATQPKLYVFNKVDTISPQEQKKLSKTHALYNPILVSATTKQGLDILKKKIQQTIHLIKS